MERIILHIDMNAFFATCEQINNPALQGKPIAVGIDGRKGVVTTASYEARKFGIHSAMPIFMAKKRCRDLIIVPTHFDLYEKYHNLFLGIIRQYFDVIEVASIDECYVDGTKYLQDKDQVDFAKFIQHKIFKQTKLTCSIGVSYNKFLAKMASDIKKPMGVTYIPHPKVKDLIWPLAIDYMYGVGKKTAPRLNEIGIKTIGDLANYNEDFILKSILGKSYLALKQRANGIDLEEVISDAGPLKSVGNSTTLDEDTDEVEKLKIVLRDLSKQVHTRLVNGNLVGDTLSITLRYSDFSTYSRSTKLPSFTNDFEVIYSTSLYLFNENYEISRKIRLLGVTVNDTKLIDKVFVQMSLFDDISNKIDKTDELIIKLNNEIGMDVFMKASNKQRLKKEEK